MTQNPTSAFSSLTGSITGLSRHVGLRTLPNLASSVASRTAQEKDMAKNTRKQGQQKAQKPTQGDGGSPAKDDTPEAPASPVGTQQEPQEGADGVNTPAKDESADENVTTLSPNSSETTMATNEGVINEQGDKVGEGTVDEYEDAGIETGGLRTGLAEHDDIDDPEPLTTEESESRSVSTYPEGGKPEFLRQHAQDGVKVTEPEGRILRDGEETQFEGEVVGNQVVVKEDVYREVYPYRSKRPTYVLVYAAGTSVPVNTLKTMGVNAPDDNKE